MIALLIGMVVLLLALWCLWIAGAILYGFGLGLRELARNARAQRRPVESAPVQEQIMELYRSEPMTSRNGHDKERQR